MYNPMTTQYVRDLLPTISPLKQSFLQAVDYFAYQSTYPIESPLGEYAKDKYNRDALVDAVNTSIRKITAGEGSPMRLDRLQLIKTIEEANFHPNTFQCVEKAVEEEAIKMIDYLSDIKDGKQRFRVNNGHHGRQYIAAAVSENIALNYKF